MIWDRPNCQWPTIPTEQETQRHIPDAGYDREKGSPASSYLRSYWVDFSVSEDKKLVSCIISVLVQTIKCVRGATACGNMTSDKKKDNLLPNPRSRLWQWQSCKWYDSHLLFLPEQEPPQNYSGPPIMFFCGYLRLDDNFLNMYVWH